MDLLLCTWGGNGGFTSAELIVNEEGGVCGRLGARFTCNGAFA